MKFTNQVQKITYINQVTDSVYHIKYTIPLDFEYKAGQYVGIQINPTHRRAYSILTVTNGEIEFLIDISPGGQASEYFKIAKIGYENLIIGPYGRFFQKETNQKKVLISTGTGIVPFLSWMINRPESSSQTNYEIVFGAKILEDELALKFLSKHEKVKITHCITRQEKPADYEIKYENCNFFAGRVTDFLKLADYENCEFYVCGADHVVNDVCRIVVEKFDTKPIVEGYG